MDIYQYTTTEQTAYQTRGVRVAGSWEWSMFKHINYSTLMKNSQFPETQVKLGEKPYKNIIRPILNVAYRSEGFDVKDIVPFVNDADNYYKSFLVRKFHERWARKNDLDTAIDESVESYVDYGGVLVKRVKGSRPEIVPPEMIAFCDQTDILGGTIALRHQYSIDQLVTIGEELGWNKEGIDKAVMNAREVKSTGNVFSNEDKVPDKSIEVFEIHGTFPETWLSKDDQIYNDKLSADKYSKQLHIITYTTDTSNQKSGVHLFKGKETKPIFKFLKRDAIYGRAFGFGGVEELFESQIWTNFNEINMTEMLKYASKVIQQTADTGFTTRNNVKGAKNGEVWIHEEGKPLSQVNTQPVNIQLFGKAVQDWELHARTTGSANDTQLGVDPASGVPLGTTQIITAAGQGIHKYRQGKLATFWGEIYRDWLLDDLQTEMNTGNKWLEDLSIDEMQEISETVMNNAFNQYVKDVTLKNDGKVAGQMLTAEMLVPLKEVYKKDFIKSSKKFLELVKDELKDIPTDVFINIASKQADLSKLTEKLSSIFRQVIANPQVLAIPAIAKLFNQLLESGGLSPMDFSSFTKEQLAIAQPPEAILSPIQPNQLPVT